MNKELEMKKEIIINRIIDFSFVLGVVLVLFPHFSKDYLPSFLFPFFGSDKVLSIYPFFVFSLFSLLLLFLKKEYKKLLFIMLACLVFCFGFFVIAEHGLFMIIDGVTQYDVEKLEGSRLSFFNIVSRLFDSKDLSFRLSISEGLFALYSAFNQFKEIILVALLIGFIYKERFDEAKRLFFIGIIISFILVILYEIIEFPFLWGSEWSLKIQETINPFFHEVYRDGSWWPPLIWQDNVLRNVFAEPSFFGYYLGFTTVAFMHLLINNKHKVLWSAFLFLSYLFAFLTNSRSGVMLVLGGTFVYCILFAIKERKINYILAILLILALAFAGNNYVVRIKEKNGIVTAYSPIEKTNTVVSPLDGNVFEVLKASFEPDDIVDSSIVRTIKTVFSLNARSNTTRYGCTFAELSIGLNNPLLGVGELYIGGYMEPALAEAGFSNGELDVWIQSQKQNGVLNNSFASFNAFTSTFADGGVLGFILDYGLLFSIIVAYIILFFRRDGFRGYKISIMLFSMIAIIIAWGFSNSLQESYLYVIVLGLALSDLLSSGRLLKHDETKV